MQDKIAVIYGINGPVVTVKNAPWLMMKEMTFVGSERLIGEVIAIHGEDTVIQVYEETSGLKVGEPVEGTAAPMSVTLGPGLIGNIFDGIERPLRAIKDLSGAFISRGLRPDAVDMKKKWNITITAKKGDKVGPCSVIGEVPETAVITNKIMVSPDTKGEIVEIVESGSYTCDDVLAKVKTESGEIKEVKAVSQWPIRTPRPSAAREAISIPMITGQRVIDVLFPLAKGGAAAIPGGFGTGKTMTQHQLAKWSDADIIIYIGCGERGNEMTDVLNEFPELIDPKTGQSLMKRTVLIANTSDMPVAAREASIYTGITIAEYFRDMGYSVALMADSTSRWAEALREMSGRLQEMPGEEGYPAYLGSRLAQFYERAGRVMSLGKVSREGALSVIGAVSPPGGDISEPVSQATLRIVKVFWGLDSSLAYKRHFPAINWLNSYSLYVDTLSDWFNKNVDSSFMERRAQVLKLLQEEAELEEIVKLVGMDALSPQDRLKLEAARSIREDFLHQNAFHDEDTYTPISKQFLMMNLILEFYNFSLHAVENGVSVDDLLNLPVKEQIGRFKYVSSKKSGEEYKNILQKVAVQVGSTLKKEDF